MNRTEKEQAVADLHDKMSRATFVAAVAFEKLDAFTAIELRRAMRKSAIDYKVVKNNLALRAAEGTAATKLDAQFTGPVALAFGYGDVVETAKAITDAFKKAQDKVRVKAAVVDGALLSVDQVEALSKLPGLPELRAQMLAMINTPATTLVRLINTPGGQLARVLQAHVDKQSEQAAA